MAFDPHFACGLRETTAYPREVAEHALAHKLPDAVERAHQRGTQFLKRQLLMAEWGLYCTTAKKNSVGDQIHAEPAQAGTLAQIG